MIFSFCYLAMLLKKNFFAWDQNLNNNNMKKKHKWEKNSLLFLLFYIYLEAALV